MAFLFEKIMEREKKQNEMELFKFAFIPKYDDAITYLVERLSDKDDQWEFSDKTGGKYPIMRNYLEHYFRRIKSEGKIAFTADNRFACFNTGLKAIFTMSRRAGLIPFTDTENRFSWGWVYEGVSRGLRRYADDARAASCLLC